MSNNSHIKQNLIVSIIGPDQFTNLLPLFKLISEYEGNITTTRVNQFNKFYITSLEIDGHWDAIAKIELAIKNLVKTHEPNLKVNMQRIDVEYEEEEFLPYKISINNLDEPGLLEKIIDFFILQEITIQELSTNSYTTEYGADLAQIYIKIKVPTDIHIPSLKEQFDILCYNENLDAELVPFKAL